MISRLAEVFNVSTDFLLGRTDEHTLSKSDNQDEFIPKSKLDAFILKAYNRVKNDALNGNPTAIKTLNELDAILRIKGSGNDD